MIYSYAWTQALGPSCFQKLGMMSQNLSSAAVVMGGILKYALNPIINQYQAPTWFSGDQVNVWGILNIARTWTKQNNKFSLMRNFSLYFCFNNWWCADFEDTAAVLEIFFLAYVTQSLPQTCGLVFPQKRREQAMAQNHFKLTLT